MSLVGTAKNMPPHSSALIASATPSIPFPDKPKTKDIAQRGA